MLGALGWQRGQDKKLGSVRGCHQQGGLLWIQRFRSFKVLLVGAESKATLGPERWGIGSRVIHPETVGHR